MKGQLLTHISREVVLRPPLAIVRSYMFNREIYVFSHYICEVLIGYMVSAAEPPPVDDMCDLVAVVVLHLTMQGAVDHIDLLLDDCGAQPCGDGFWGWRDERTDRSYDVARVTIAEAKDQSAGRVLRLGAHS